MRKRYLLIVTNAFIIVFINNCFIQEVNQPDTVCTGSVFQTTLQIHDMNSVSEPHKGVICTMVPDDWNFLSGSYKSPMGDGIIELNAALGRPIYGNTDSLIVPPPNMKWIKCLSDTGYAHNADINYELTLNFKVGYKQGNFPIGYLITTNDNNMLDLLQEDDIEDSDDGADTLMRQWVTVIGGTAEWDMNLIASANSFFDSLNYLGTSFSATDDFDQSIDIPEPPPAASNYLQLCFTHDDWDSPTNRLSTDIRYPVDLFYFQQKWDFSVVTDQVSEIHTIELTNLNGINWDIGVYIFDVDGEEITQLSSTSNIITFTPTEAGEYKYQIIVGRLYPVQEAQRTFYSGWNLIGLPLKPIVNSYDEIIGDDLNNNGYLYTYNGSLGYKKTDNFVMGQGYWLGLLSTETVEYVGDSIGTEVSIPLNSSNNLISNPYKYMIDKNHLKFTKSGTTYSFADAVANSWISEAIHRWYNGYDGHDGEAYFPTDTLGVWEGGWLYTLTDNVNMIIQPVVATKSYSSANVLSYENAWSVDLELFANWGVDQSNTFGMCPDASDEFDAQYDFPEPPTSPSGKYLTGYFRHDNWTNLGPKYDKDIRQLKDNYETWEYTIRSSMNGNVQVSWNLHNFPDYFCLYLYDPILNTYIDMKNRSSYSFNYQDITTFEIIRTIAGAIDEEGEIPTEFGISQNYPNPFNPTTTIQYDIPKASYVTLTIYNINGQLVSTLVREDQSAGYYSVQLNANKLCSGVYIYKITAGEFTDIKKCIVVK